jgi:hypothetical protein
VNPLRSLARPVRRGFDGVTVVRFSSRLALSQSDGFAIGYVNCGQKDKRGDFVLFDHRLPRWVSRLILARERAGIAP